MDFYLDREPGHIRVPSTANVTYPACALLPGTSQADGHHNGQLLGRIWWDIKTGIDPFDPDPAQQLFADWTMISNGSAAPHNNCDSFDQPADTGTLVEVLTANDNDSDLSNGTPNDAVICQAFSGRGIDSPPGLGLCPLPLSGGTCRADLNYDESLDIFDFLEFECMFAAGDRFCDFTGDSKLDLFDFLAFQMEFAAGCW